MKIKQEIRRQNYKEKCQNSNLKDGDPSLWAQRDVLSGLVRPVWAWVKEFWFDCCPLSVLILWYWLEVGSWSWGPCLQNIPVLILLFCWHELVPGLDGGESRVPESSTAWHSVGPSSHCVEQHLTCQVRLLGETVRQHLTGVNVADLLDCLIIMNGLPDIDHVCLQSIVTARTNVVNTRPEIFRVSEGETRNTMQ